MCLCGSVLYMNRKVGNWVTKVKKIKVSSYIAQYPMFRISQSAFYTLLSGRSVQSKTIPASLGSIQPRGNFAKIARTQIFTTVYNQVFLHKAE